MRREKRNDDLGESSAFSKQGLKIQELAARSGVSKSTIHYYIRKQLLPPPRKVNRTMAYYDEEYVDRIRLIRGFQEKAFLPLGRIKRLLDTVRENGILENILVISSQYVSGLANSVPARTMSEAEVRAEFGFSGERLEHLEQVGVLTPELKKGRRLYHPEDVEILKVLVRMAERGLVPERGWSVEGLSLYVKAASELAEKEVARLMRRMEKGLSRGEAESLFNNSGEDIYLNLFLWLRRRAMRKEFAKGVKGMRREAPGAE